MSRVVPGICETIATSRRAADSSSVDLPTFGGPCDRDHEPVAQAFSSARGASTSAICAMEARTRAPARGKLPTSPSSEKSSSAASNAEASMICRANPPPAAERPASSQRLAALKFSLRVDQIGEASACDKSILPLLKARRANSPGSAARNPVRRLSSEKARRHRAAPVEMKFGAVFPGRRIGSGEPERQAPVKRLVCFGIAKTRGPCASASAARSAGVTRTGDGDHKASRTQGPDETDHRDRRRARACRQSENRVHTIRQASPSQGSLTGARRTLRAPAPASGVHRIEERRVALRRLAQLAEQELDRVDRAHRIENSAQHVHLLRECRAGAEQLLPCACRTS